jgi:hypothetical protein
MYATNMGGSGTREGTMMPTGDIQVNRYNPAITEVAVDDGDMKLAMQVQVIKEEIKELFQQQLQAVKATPQAAPEDTAKGIVPVAAEGNDTIVRDILAQSSEREKELMEKNEALQRRLRVERETKNLRMDGMVDVDPKPRRSISAKVDTPATGGTKAAQKKAKHANTQADTPATAKTKAETPSTGSTKAAQNKGKHGNTQVKAEEVVVKVKVEPGLAVEGGTRAGSARTKHPRTVDSGDDIPGPNVPANTKGARTGASRAVKKSKPNTDNEKPKPNTNDEDSDSMSASEVLKMTEGGVYLNGDQ